MLLQPFSSKLPWYYTHQLHSSSSEDMKTLLVTDLQIGPQFENVTSTSTWHLPGREDLTEKPYSVALWEV